MKTYRSTAIFLLLVACFQLALYNVRLSFYHAPAILHQTTDLTVDPFRNDDFSVVYGTMGNNTAVNQSIADHFLDITRSNPMTSEVIDSTELQRRYLALETPPTKELKDWLANAFNGTRNFRMISPSKKNKGNEVVGVSCCGLGHRLFRLEFSAHLALLMEAEYRVVWKDCGMDTFQRLFGPEPLLSFQNETVLDQTDKDTSSSYRISIMNDPPHCYRLKQAYKKSELCPHIHRGIRQIIPKFYRILMDRYVRRDVVQNFTQTHFDGRISIGMHVRAGNNETGHFQRRKRGVQNMTQFIQLNTERIRSFVPEGKSAILFIATDTPSYVDAFRKSLNDTMPVVELEQVRAEEGKGIFFGEFTAPKPKGETCLESWHAAIQDMMILSSTDIVFAPLYSSFTRSMPRVIALSRENRRIEKSFCEVWKRGNEGMVCYESLADFNARPPPQW